jgi:hypothetical protein
MMGGCFGVPSQGLPEYGEPLGEQAKPKKKGAPAIPGRDGRSLLVLCALFS